MFKRHQSICYKSDNINYIELNDDCIIHIKPIDNTIARIYFSDKNNYPIKVPNDIKLFDSSKTEQKPFFNNFFVVYFENYTLYYQNTILLKLANQHLQKLIVKDGFKTGVIDSDI
jgi:hypothetical protein